MRNIAQLKVLPLEQKIQMTISRIRQWYEYWDGEVYVSFSEGKDSQVLLHIIRGLYPDVPAVFINTGMEFPELVKHVKKFDNVVWLKPKMSFWGVIGKYGWPVVSKESAQKIYEINTTKSEKLKNKRLYGQDNSGKLAEKWKCLIGEKISDKCCHFLKKEPIKRYEKSTDRKPIIGIMSEESRLRAQRAQCNIIDAKRPSSAPLLFWTESDIWEYVELHNLKLAPPYYEGEKRTGCMFCLFGCHLDKEPRFLRIKEKHPALYRVFEKYGGLEIYEKVMACHHGRDLCQKPLQKCAQEVQK